MRYGRRRLKTTCGVPKKNGEPCLYKLIDGNGRCPYHGGKLEGKDLEHWRKSVETIWAGYRRYLERCRASGIQSTGPKTAEGKAKVTANLPFARKRTSSALSRKPPVP